MPPMNGKVLVQCSHCGLTVFKSIENSQNNGTRNDAGKDGGRGPPPTRF